MTLPPFLQDLENRQYAYEPAAATKAILANKVLVTLVAPTAVGKSSLAQRVVQLGGTEFAESYSVVTRARRPDDPTGYKTSSEGYTIARVAGMIDLRELTHYVIHPSGNIYGSLPESFPAHYNLLPCVPSIIEVVKKAGFSAVHTLYIVTTADEWAQRLAHRRMAPDYRARLGEAVESLTWAIAHHDELAFIENTTGQLDQTAKLIIGLIRGEVPNTDTVRGVSRANDMLTFARNELKRA